MRLGTATLVADDTERVLQKSDCTSCCAMCALHVYDDGVYRHSTCVCPDLCQCFASFTINAYVGNRPTGGHHRGAGRSHCFQATSTDHADCSDTKRTLAQRKKASSIRRSVDDDRLCASLQARRQDIVDGSCGLHSTCGTWYGPHNPRASSIG